MDTLETRTILVGTLIAVFAVAMMTQYMVADADARRGNRNNNDQVGVGNNNQQAGDDLDANAERCDDCGSQSNNDNDLDADRGGSIRIG
jgi:hypothetical protein